VAQKDLCRLQPLHEVIQRLIQGGLIGVDLLWIFVSHHIQPLHQREITMWIYPGPSCPNFAFSTELDDTEINTRKGRVVSPWVSLLELTFMCLCQFQLLNAYVFLRRILGTHEVPCGGPPYPRMWQGGRPTVPTMNGCGHGGKGGGLGVLPGQP
jgi:hypothetical protein